MKLRSERPFWFLKNGLVQSYPHLAEKRTCDVVIVGAGITGSLIGNQLVEHGLDVVILDSRDVGCGSTSASTALLQYEIDTSLRELQRLCGPVANDLYRAGVDAIRYLKSLSEQLDFDVEFRSCPSCYLAANYNDAEDLQSEAISRQAQRIAVEYWNEQKVQSQFDFPGVGALWSHEAAQVNPYLLTHALLRKITQSGSLVFDRSPIIDLEHHADGVTLHTESGAVFGRFGIIAAGYESQVFLPNTVATLTSTFAFVTEPLAEFPGWPEECLIWETARPYLYLRTTADHRMLAGGADLPFRNERLRDTLLPRQIEQIEKRVRSMFPRIPFTVDYSWAGTFAETPDGLPFIGSHPKRPHLLFAMCYGGNGITFSVLAAEVIRDHLLGKVHPLAGAVAFDRPSLTSAMARA